MQSVQSLFGFLSVSRFSFLCHDNKEFSKCMNEIIWILIDFVALFGGGQLLDTGRVLWTRLTILISYLYTKTSC